MKIVIEKVVFEDDKTYSGFTLEVLESVFDNTIETTQEA